MVNEPELRPGSHPTHEGVWILCGHKTSCLIFKHGLIMQHDAAKTLYTLFLHHQAEKLIRPNLSLMGVLEICALSARGTT